MTFFSKVVILLVTLYVLGVKSQTATTTALLANGLTQSQANTFFDNWAQGYALSFPDATTSNVAHNVLNDRLNNIQLNNLGRASDGYVLGTNRYSSLSYSDFAAGHLGANYVGMNYANGTDLYSVKNSIRGGALAGIIVGSVIGGLLVIAGLISSFIAWREHEKRRHSTLYADYRSNYVPKRKDRIADHVPNEYYRESHHQMITPVFLKETNASTEYRRDHQIVYRDHQNNREAVIPTSSEFYNQQDQYENPPHLYRK